MNTTILLWSCIAAIGLSASALRLFIVAGRMLRFACTVEPAEQADALAGTFRLERWLVRMLARSTPLIWAALTGRLAEHREQSHRLREVIAAVRRDMEAQRARRAAFKAVLAESDALRRTSMNLE